MSQHQIIQQTIDFVQTALQDAEGGHDWWHIERVWKLSKKIAETESADQFVVEMGALLHDIADSKFNNGDEEIGPQTARNFLESLNLEQEIITSVVNIVRHISFKGSLEGQKWTSPELQVVQDADRLDAIGAIGIARAFNYGGYKNRPLYNPAVPSVKNQTKQQYKNNTAPTINHFYEKLLLLKGKMNTATGKKIAEGRHAFLEQYLAQFYAEWNAEC